MQIKMHFIDMIYSDICVPAHFNLCLLQSYFGVLIFAFFLNVPLKRIVLLINLIRFMICVVVKWCITYVNKHYFIVDQS